MKKELYILLFASVLLSCINAFSQGAAINTSGATADPSAMLDISSTTKGTLLFARMTTNERNAIANPASGLLIINTTTNCIEVYFSPMWQTVFCGCSPPLLPSEGTHSATATEITWNWNSVSGATGYKYNTINDYASATDNGTNTSYTQTGLTCNTSYTLYVWAYNNCGSSTELFLSESTTSCLSSACGTVSFTYNNSPVTYGTVNGDYNSGQYCWLDRNLGASAVATARDHVDGYGDLFQWGRLDDGHQIRSNNNSTTTLSTTDVPGHSNFITPLDEPNDWRSARNNSLWQGVSGINNPCPTGWRLPTETELNNELST